MDGLIEVAKEMKKNAVEVEIGSRGGKMMGTFSDPMRFALAQQELRRSQKIVRIDDCEIRLTFTSDTLLDKHAWHLSLGRTDFKILSEDIVKKILETFFPGDTFFPSGKIVEIPSLMHGKKVRQFLRLED